MSLYDKLFSFNLFSSKLILIFVTILIGIHSSAFGQKIPDRTLKALDSSSTLTRRVAQTDLIEYLENADLRERPALIQNFIDLLPASTDFAKIGICNALAG